ncbi:MAG: helix-turn-helix domain-containing protein [Pseudomonadota bacterium]
MTSAFDLQIPFTPPVPRSDAARHLLRAACRLFAERGLDGVTVREIADAAGQKNHGAVAYHFGSKEALAQALVVDGAALIDARRNAWLDAMEAAGGPNSVRAVAEVLIQAGLDLDGPGVASHYNRFVVLLGMTHRQFFMDTLAGRWNRGYQRCLAHLRRLMPAMPAAQQNQRFIFLGAYLGGVLAARDAELADTSRAHPTWQAPSTLAHFAATMEALLQAPADSR